MHRYHSVLIIINLVMFPRSFLPAALPDYSLYVGTSNIFLKCVSAWHQVGGFGKLVRFLVACLMTSTSDPFMFPRYPRGWVFCLITLHPTPFPIPKHGATLSHSVKSHVGSRQVWWHSSSESPWIFIAVVYRWLSDARWHYDFVQ